MKTVILTSRDFDVRLLNTETELMSKGKKTYTAARGGAARGGQPHVF
jgi:hypothetical protein